MKWFNAITNFAGALCVIMFVVLVSMAFISINKTNELKLQISTGKSITAICDLNVTEPNDDEISINCKLE